MKKLILAFAIISFAVVSCEKKIETLVTTDENQDTIKIENTDILAANDDTGLRVDEHNSKNSLDWEGTYEGTLPCADCPGIKTIVELSKDKIKITSEYLERNTTSVDEGNFKWTNDQNAVYIDTKNNGRFFYKIEENKLIALTEEGLEIKDSNLNYVLNKK